MTEKAELLTDEELREALRTCRDETIANLRVIWPYTKEFARTVEAAVLRKLAEQRPDEFQCPYCYDAPVPGSMIEAQRAYGERVNADVLRKMPPKE